MKRKKFVAGNWKMNLDLEGAKALAMELNAHTGEFHCDVALFPSYVFLAEVQNTLKHSKIRLGAQNLSYSENGAYTGEVSASMLASIGMDYVLIGHSEGGMITIGAIEKGIKVDYLLQWASPIVKRGSISYCIAM